MKQVIEKIKSLFGIQSNDSNEKEVQEMLEDSYLHLEELKQPLSLKAAQDIQDLMDMIEAHEQEVRDLEGTPNTFTTVFESEEK
ncbi:MAG TPA: hypothetical protein VM577_02195 [Anaerovoracaceae bacterium]|nr:hypothetical protein [Anaerovoracaceae bacterium]